MGKQAGKAVFVYMCNVKEYRDIFNRIEKLSQDDTMQLIMESNDDDEKAFYEKVGDYLLQKKQKKVIERNLF